MTSLGISSYTYRWAMQSGQLDAWRLVECVASQGLQVLQFLDNVRLDTWSDDELRALGRAATGRVTLQLGMSGLDGEKLARYVEVARLCGASVIRATAEGDVDVASRTLVGLLPTLRAAGITVALENHFGITSDQLVALIQQVGDPHVAVCLDTLNSIALLEGPAETVARLAPFTVCVHLKDGITRRAGTGFTVVGAPLGEGLLDLPALLRVVWATGRRPPLLIELWQDAEGDDAATLAAEANWVARSLAYARRLAEMAED